MQQAGNWCRGVLAHRGAKFQFDAEAQGIVEFHLQIPAVAVLFVVLLGSLRRAEPAP